jgi:hypothetical protein
MHELGEFENLANIFNVYEQFLITPEKLKVMNKNVEYFLDIPSNLEKFSHLKELYVNKSYNSGNERAK